MSVIQLNNTAMAPKAIKVLLALNVISLFLYSPNYLSVVLPGVKYYILFVVGLSFIYVFVTGAKISFNFMLFCLVFSLSLAATSIFSYYQNNNPISVEFAVSYIVKIIHFCLIYFLVRNKDSLDFLVRLLLLCFMALAAHTILQFLLFFLGLIRPDGEIIETQGYKFYFMGVWGWYRVSASFLGFEFIRAQSFFQEPGFLSFYMCFALFFVHAIKEMLTSFFYKFCVILFSVCVFTTLSFTGLIVVFLFFLLCFRFLFLKVLFFVFCFFALVYVLMADNPYIAKAGSLDMRVYDFIEVASLLLDVEKFLFGIGFGLESNYLGSAKANNFLIELFLYSGLLGFSVFCIYFIYVFLLASRELKALLFVVVSYSLSTPMIWSPLFLLAIVYSERRRILEKKHAGS